MARAAPARTGHGHRPDQDDQRRPGQGRPRRGHRGRAAGPEHLRLVRPGRQGQRLVPRGGHQGVRGRQGGQYRGSWEAGVDGAQPGMLLPADPRRDMAYRQEYHKGQAEDAARVLSLDMRAEVPAGSFDQLLTTQDSTPLEPKLLEHKFYAPGVGPVLAIRLGAAPAGGAGPLQARPLNDLRLLGDSWIASLQVGSPVWGEADGPTGMPTFGVSRALPERTGRDRRRWPMNGRDESPSSSGRCGSSRGRRSIWAGTSTRGTRPTT